MAPRALDRTTPEALWRQLQRALLERLEAGEFTEHFPAESTLVEEYGVSRHTVRQALAQLRADGVVTAERGRQPRIAHPAEIQQPVGALYSLFASVEAAGLPQRSIVRTCETRADALVAERLELEASAPLVYLERLRLADEQPLALDRVWLPADLAAPLLEVDFTRTGLYRELADQAGVRLHHGHEDIHAVPPTPEERTHLDCPDHVAAFSIHRLGHTRSRPVEWRHTLVRGDRYALAADFSATAGYQLRQPPSANP
jgi:GntR family transcriptional regulator